MKHFLLRCSCSPSPEKWHEEVCAADKSIFTLGYLKDLETQTQASPPRLYIIYIFSYVILTALGI